MNLVARALASHLLYIALRDGDPSTMEQLDAPDQGTDQGPDSIVGLSQEEISLTSHGHHQERPGGGIASR